MKRRSFSDPQMQKAYDLYRDAPPQSGTFQGGLGAAYRRGRSHPDRQQYVRGSLAYAAWAAGVDAAND